MLRSKLSSLREYLTPINHNSNFLTTGEISPEEFVKAGDYLVYKFPTWQWSTCPKNLQKSFLPPEKQVLVTKHVPSHVRASNFEGELEEDDEEVVLGADNDGDDDKKEEDEEYGLIKSKTTTGQSKGKTSESNNNEEIGDIDDMIDNDAEEADDLDHDFDDLDIVYDSNNKLRKYDLYITYSTSYRVPKMYLVGFDSNGIPLLPKQMYEDINSDYKDKTVTIENLPVASNTTSISIHPCKHSSVMKVLMSHQLRKKEKPVEEDLSNLSIENIEPEAEGIRVDQYLVVFLKFIASVTPGIEYDYTMDAL
ncbi:Atg3 protein [Candida orthopsilosis Co 90-125]|uniref:Autophagy-related protein 3 n=1 Tax=Candida orthopsilosis (strain 90-125) TaxID=1136231 RepID=H8X279_CANO9|nr:Atg3 protein [Candida orthopsilosis Co 90-125]CCG22801.1 Atg3 protein [Candida orthopsilosis Co 90-125]